MPEQRSILYTKWEDQPGTYDECIECRRKGKAAFGILKRRRVTGRDGEMHTEYKVVCNLCERATAVHRSKLVTIKEWEGNQEPGDGLKYRNRKHG